MYDNILVPADGSTEAQRGVDHGIELATAVDATVHALYVIEEGGNPWSSESMEDQTERARAYGRDIVDEVSEQASDAGVDCVTAIEIGPAVHEKINDYAAAEDVDLIVMGSGYRGSIGGLLGGTAEKVLRSASVPVTTIRHSDFE